MRDVPEGWVLVPREPTEAMVKAGAIAAAEVPPMRNRDQAVACFNAMLAATPVKEGGDHIGEANEMIRTHVGGEGVERAARVIGALFAARNDGKSVLLSTMPPASEVAQALSDAGLLRKEGEG